MPKKDRGSRPAVKGDVYEREEFKRWANDMRRRLIPKMEGSNSVLMLAPDLSADFDISFALQIGATIMLEKPLILVIHPGRNIPSKLRAIADKIIEVNLDGVTMNDAEIQEQIRQAMVDLGKQ